MEIDALHMGGNMVQSNSSTAHITSQTPLAPGHQCLGNLSKRSGTFTLYSKGLPVRCPVDDAVLSLRTVPSEPSRPTI